MSKNLAKIKTPKVIADPIYGIIDVRPVLPMIETREFQALGDKRQLGMAYLTFPSATHSRKAHSLGAYHATRELADWWIKRGFINEREGRALAGYALYHDIGHPAFSHVTENLCALPPGVKTGPKMSMNSALSLHIIKKSRAIIEAAGIDFKLMLAIATHNNPLHLAVSDRNLGMEKLDYLERDGAYTILSRPIGVEYLRHHIYFINRQLAIDEKAVDNAVELQNYYLKIYKNVYLRKTPMIAQRMLQKMTYHLIKSGELSSGELSGLTDSELIGLMRFSKSKIVSELYELLKRRDLFREAVVIRPEKFSKGEAKAGKGTVIAATPAQIRHLATSPKLNPKNQEALGALENNIARMAGLPDHSVLITPIYGQERFEAKDIMIYEGRGKKLASLRERYPAHFRNMEEVGQAYLAFRVCTTEKYRAKLSAPKMAKKVFACVMGA